MNPPLPDPVAALAAILVERAGPAVVALYLFGSQAENRAHRESDLDLGVVLRHDQCPTARERFEEGLRLAAAIRVELGEPELDLVILNDAPPGLAARVAAAGRLVYCADREAEHAFRRDAQLRAADVEPFLRRTRRIKLEVLRR